MIRAIKQLLFRARPSVPAVNRWSKLGPALDIVLPLVLVHNLMHKLLELLGSASGAGEDAGHDMADDELDAALKSEFDFSKLQGLRYKASLSYFGNASTSNSLLVLALCLEPIRSVSAWWMRRARTGDARLRDGFLDMLFEPVSPLQSALQYLASMLTGESARLVLLWRPIAGSYAEFCARRPDLVRDFRRCILVTAASMYRRHSCVYGDLTWAISKLADSRVPMQERCDLASAFEAVEPCCIASGAIRHLKAAGITGAALLKEEQWHEYLRWRCHMIMQQVCDLEWKHAGNRARSHEHGQTKVSTMIADYVNTDARALHESHRKCKDHLVAVAKKVAEERCGLPAGAPGGAAGAPGGAPDPELGEHGEPARRKRLRRCTALQLLGFDELAAAKARGEKPNPATAPWHRHVSQVWDGLSPELRADYEGAADSSAVEAAVARRERR